jgi:hypothetical protein
MQQLLLLSYEASATFSETWKTSVTPGEAWVNVFYISYPQECRYLLEKLRDVYHNDSSTRQHAMSSAASGRYTPWRDRVRFRSPSRPSAARHAVACTPRAATHACRRDATDTLYPWLC